VKAKLTEMLPFASMVSLLIELDKRTGYLDCLTPRWRQAALRPRSHAYPAHGAAGALSEPRTARMAEACGISCDLLTRTSEWYVREETLRVANLAIIDYH
jgi:hypothetical protein